MTGDDNVVAHGGDSPSLLALSVYESFYKHYPLKLNANVIWVTIVQVGNYGSRGLCDDSSSALVLQGLGRFIQVDPEKFRSKFVAHEGKKQLRVVDPTGAGPGSMNWPLAFAGFAEEIGKAIGAPTLELLTATFSNSTNSDIMASQITLMDVMQSYFHYNLCGGCGIPWVELQGSCADWRALQTKAEGLRALDVGDLTARGKHPCMDKTLRGGLGAWLDALIPVLGKLAEAAAGAPDSGFFGAVCNGDGGSGRIGEPITGWVTVFYPFDRKGACMQYGTWRDIYAHTHSSGGADAALATAEARGKGAFVSPKGGLDLNNIPTGLAQAPVTLTIEGVPTSWDLRFIAGPTTLHQSPDDGSLEVRCGWAVCETASSPAGLA